MNYLTLDGKCFAENIGRYEYQICPFRNVTQLDKQTTWNPFYGLLGIWGKWKANDSADSQFQVQQYNDGTRCGNNIKRKVRVNFECNERYGISKVEEPRTCDYTMIFHCQKLATLHYQTQFHIIHIFFQWFRGGN